MNTIYKAIATGLVTSVNVTKRGVTVYSQKKPNGIFYTLEDFEKTILPKLSTKLSTLEPQA